MSAWTPGPWAVFRTDFEGSVVVGVTTRAAEHIDSDGDGADICEMQNEGYFGKEQFEANAALVASAPALVSALEKAEAELAVFHDPEATIASRIGRTDSALGIIRHALRLARGEE